MPFEKKIVLAGSHREPMSGASVARAIENNEIVSATVVLRRRTPTASAESFAFTDPQTVHHHTRQEYGTLHGAAPADIAAIEAFAHEFGLTVSERSQARRTVVLSGTAENMQRAFGTSLAYYDSPHGRYRGRTGPIMIPEELQPLVTAVLGLDNRPVAKPHVRIHASQPPGSLTPPQVAKLYNFPTGVSGAGQTIAILELGGGFRTSDLKTYFDSLGIKPPAVTSVAVDQGVNKPGVDKNSDGEVMLDIEVAGAVAPGARIVVYFAPNTDQGFHDAITTAVHDTVHNPSILSISWGGPEDTWTQQSRDAMLQAVTDAAAVGVTVTVAAGDDGATDGESDGKLHVDLPACLPPVLACGGTRLNTSNGALASEVVWNELASKEGATGGGVSKLFALPSYQSSAGVPKQPETNFAGRGVPDVAGDADPVTGYVVRVDGKKTVIGGTSAVAPLWAGLTALINQQLGRPLGFVQPALYQVGSVAFRDITSGNNGHYSARANWDACTGLGSPDGAALVKALIGKTTAAESV
ncbi:MAG TPA: S53 family peptidase [Bryobacteraceae bacterium]|nr:S53 family peptidase [Bryobacteraceae bacterium]